MGKFGLSLDKIPDFGVIFGYHMGNHMENHMINQIVKSLIRNSNWKYDFGEIRADYSLGYARRALGWSFGGILGQVIQKVSKYEFG